MQEDCNSPQWNISELPLELSRHKFHLHQYSIYLLLNTHRDVLSVCVFKVCNHEGQRALHPPFAFPTKLQADVASDSLFCDRSICCSLSCRTTTNHNPHNTCVASKVLDLFRFVGISAARKPQLSVLLAEWAKARYLTSGSPAGFVKTISIITWKSIL